MYNTDRISGYSKYGPFTFMEQANWSLKGKEWARGYTAEAIAKRDRAFKRFDIRNLFKGRGNGK